MKKCNCSISHARSKKNARIDDKTRSPKEIYRSNPKDVLKTNQREQDRQAQRMAFACLHCRFALKRFIFGSKENTTNFFRKEVDKVERVEGRKEGRKEEGRKEVGRRWRFKGLLRCVSVVSHGWRNGHPTMSLYHYVTMSPSHQVTRLRYQQSHPIPSR